MIQSASGTSSTRPCDRATAHVAWRIDGFRNPPPVDEIDDEQGERDRDASSASSTPVTTSTVSTAAIMRAARSQLLRSSERALQPSGDPEEAESTVGRRYQTGAATQNGPRRRARRGAPRRLAASVKSPYTAGPGAAHVGAERAGLAQHVGKPRARPRPRRDRWAAARVRHVRQAATASSSARRRSLEPRRAAELVEPRVHLGRGALAGALRRAPRPSSSPAAARSGASRSPAPSASFGPGSTKNGTSEPTRAASSCSRSAPERSAGARGSRARAPRRRPRSRRPGRRRPGSASRSARASGARRRPPPARRSSAPRTSVSLEALDLEGVAAARARPGRRGRSAA